VIGFPLEPGRAGGPAPTKLGTGLALLSMHDSPVLSSPAHMQASRPLYRAAKRTIDLTAGGLALALLSPLIGLVAIQIRREDSGPAFYRAPRVGLNGRTFRMYKFRTMVTNADRIGGPSTAGDDPRITKMGHRIRTSKLDEIPQLINVVKGEMSLVGPRPEVQHYVDMFTERERDILSVKPGITDWASIRYRNEGEILRGAEDPEQAYMEKIRPGKLELQLAYVRRQSLWLDLKILAATARVLFE
jgi:lipopolysaccharide/colanic/teichoic acid biosynthesis glycosyltransferase